MALDNHTVELELVEQAKAILAQYDLGNKSTARAMFRQVPPFRQGLVAGYMFVCQGCGGEVLTTGCYVTKDDESNIDKQMKREIANIEGEKPEELMIVSQVDHWSVHVPGRFAAIGRIYALAMLDPEWRP